MAHTAETYLQSGIEKYQQGLLAEAIADWAEAILLDPNYALAYYKRGSAKSDLGDNQGAILDYARCATAPKRLRPLRGGFFEIRQLRARDARRGDVCAAFSAGGI